MIVGSFTPGVLSLFLGRLVRDQAGNALMIIAAALLPLVAMVGGGLDIGRGYLVQARLQQACDAGVLAARKRLGTETVTSGQLPSQTAEIGDRFFRTNFKDGAYGSTGRSFEMTLQEDYSITGVASVETPTTLMSMFGEDSMDVRVDCSAQLNFANTDVMMVLDVTGSMATSNPGDTASRLEVLKDTIRTFHQQLQATAQAGSRIRYGFLPYSTNVNVGGILKDEWMVESWGYQSRKLKQTGGVTSKTFSTASSPISGSMTRTTHDTYTATRDYWGNYRCSSKPADAVSTSTTKTAETSELVIGPPPGTRTTKTYQRTRSGDAFEVSLDGSVCTVTKTSYRAYKDTYNIITEPSYDNNGKWIYDRIAYDVSNWRAETLGCVEERQTYEIDDYANVDLKKALDLDIDLVPTDNPAALGISIVEDLHGQAFDISLGATNRVDFDNSAATKWRPMYPDWIYGREKEYNGAGSFSTSEKQTAKEFISPRLMGTDACPAPAAKLSTMTAAQLDTYLATLYADGSTYHDIGMIWGGRMISPSGLFAQENADVSPSSPTSRNLIFLTDGETSALDISYGAYGFEPVDRRRWSPSSRYTLVETIEKRFGFACSEVKKRGVTVWVIGFGVELNNMMRTCAGQGHYFEAADAAELNLAFGAISKKVSELRIVQ